jgi:hypothetical protein
MALSPSGGPGWLRRPEAIMLAHGFKIELLAALARDGLATTQRGTMCAGRRQIDVVWVTITDAGRRALAGV